MGVRQQAGVNYAEILIQLDADGRHARPRPSRPPDRIRAHLLFVGVPSRPHGIVQFTLLLASMPSSSGAMTSLMLLTA